MIIINIKNLTFGKKHSCSNLADFRQYAFAANDSCNNIGDFKMFSRSLILLNNHKKDINFKVKSKPISLYYSSRAVRATFKLFYPEKIESIYKEYLAPAGRGLPHPAPKGGQCSWPPGG